MRKIILLLNLFLVFNLGFSDLESRIRNHYNNKTIELNVIEKRNGIPVKGDYIDGKWYAWYDGTFLGKEEVMKEKYHRFKTLEIDVIGVEMEYGKDEMLESDRVLKDIYLKVTDFKVIDFNGAIYTKNNYTNEKNETFIPTIITDETINRFLVDNHKNIKFIGTERKNPKTGRTELDTVPTKLVLNNSNGFKICATSNGKKLYYSLWKCEN